MTKESILRQLIDLRQLVFEVTDDCNLSCRYCAYGELYEGYDAREAQYMRFENVKKLVDYLVALWQQHESSCLYSDIAVSFYGGEPLLNMGFIRDAIAYLESVSGIRKAIYSMTTNGLLLDRCVEYLVEKDFQLLISLDGDKDSDSYRVDKAGNPSFDKVARNVRILQERYPDFYKKRVNFNVVLHNRNNFIDVVRFFQKEFDKLPHWSELSSVGVRPEKRDIFVNMFRSAKQNLHESLEYKGLLPDMFIQDPFVKDVFSYLQHDSGAFYQYYEELFSTGESELDFSTGTCIPFSRKMFVTVNGKILPCEKVSHRFSYGQVGKDDFSLSLEAVAEQFNGYLEQLEKQCVLCAKRQDCPHCLYNIPLDENGFHCARYALERKKHKEEAYVFSYLAKHPELYKKLLTEIVVA